MLTSKIKKLLIQLHQGKIIIYPTESVFGLGCDPDNKEAIFNLLKIKKRSWKKGLILIAANYKQLLKYIDDNALNKKQRSRMFETWPGPMTWLVPANVNTPYWLTGDFSFLAIRVIHYPPIRRLCLAFGKPLVSTSANLSGYPPARTFIEVYNQLGKYNLLMMRENVLESFLNPSKIRNVITGEFIRE